MPRLARVAASFFILYIIYLGSLRFFLYLCSQITNIMRAIRLKFLLLSSLMTWCFLTARAQEEIIEHEGSKYIIHVEQLNPDSEMTLLDVLHICPELMSDDGKTLTANYLLSVDDIMLSVDYEPLLEGIKACDLKEVIVCTYGAVNNAMDGIQGSIDLQFKEGKGMTGKIGLSGSTYGNGQLFTDIASRGENVTVRSFVQTNLHYGKVDAQSGERITSRNGVENAMVFVDWQATENDLLKLKLSQGYGEHKDRVRDQDTNLEMLNRQRWGELVATYERTLNDQEAGLYIETGLNYESDNIDETGIRAAVPWWIAEFSIPFLNQALNMTIGYEGGYANLWYQELRREQNLNNDLYLLLDFKKGPWIVSLGDRFRYNRFWVKQYIMGDGSLWSYGRGDHALIASVGYRWGHHFVQAVFNRSFFNPNASDFMDYVEEEPLRYNTNYKTNLAWRYEARYTYQTEHLAATASVTHTLLSDMLIPNESLTGLGTSLTWHQGTLRLTAGANVYHRHLSYDDPIDNTFFTLKLAPTLLLGNGFRLSSVLLYNSKRGDYENDGHLYASIKMNKDLGKHCNIFADFHDIAGQPRGDMHNLMQSFKNRALTIGVTFYPWR